MTCTCSEVDLHGVACVAKVDGISGATHVDGLTLSKMFAASYIDDGKADGSNG